MALLSGDFCGTEVAKRQVCGLHIVESVYQPNQSLPWHTHRWPYFTFVLRGNYTEHCEGKAWKIAEGDMILHVAGEAHADRIAAESWLLNVELTQPWLDRVSAVGARLDARVTANRKRFLHLGKRLHRELWSDERISSLCIEGLVLELIAESVQPEPVSSPGAPWLNVAVEYLHANFRESPTLGEVAEAVGVHPVHLAREFRRKQGMTVGEYIRKLRVDLACGELIRSAQPIVDIAAGAGFADHSHMTRVFRQELGLTPTEFRTLHRRA